MFPVVPGLCPNCVVGDTDSLPWPLAALGCHTSLVSLHIEQQTWHSGSVECPTFWICLNVAPSPPFKTFSLNSPWFYWRKMNEWPGCWQQRGREKFLFYPQGQNCAICFHLDRVKDSPRAVPKPVAHWVGWCIQVCLCWRSGFRGSSWEGFAMVHLRGCSPGVREWCGLLTCPERWLCPLMCVPLGRDLR